MSNNIIDLLAQAKNYQKHRNKVESIMSSQHRNATGAFNHKRIEFINSFYSNHQRACRYSARAKQEAVEKQNELILKKILDANNRRSSNVSRIARNYSHNSLINMKKSMQTIRSQNQLIANKIVSASSDLRQEKLSKSYKGHLERKERLKKYEYDDIGMVIPKKIKSLHKIQNLGSVRAQNFQASRYQYLSTESEAFRVK